MSNLISFEEFKELWEADPIIIIDSCSLLDLYRYAPNASKKILENLKSIQENIWLPSHVLHEFLENKENVISKEFKKYENASSEVNKAIRKAESTIATKFNRYGKFKYPQINEFRKDLEELTSSLKEKAKGFKDAVATEIEENKAILRSDEVHSFTQTLNESNQIGLSFTLPEKIEIYREGELRYSHLIPPGYEDEDKDKEDPTKTKKYGDLIIWKELLRKASQVDKPFILITDDEKEDWWNLKKHNSHLGSRSELLGPRSELISEFDARSVGEENKFLMLTLPDLNKYISLINEVNSKEVYLDYLELNPEEEVWDIVDKRNWSNILNESDQMVTSLIHDGELQDLLGEVLM
jgi:hypothetical protein